MTERTEIPAVDVSLPSAHRDAPSVDDVARGLPASTPEQVDHPNDLDRPVGAMASEAPVSYGELLANRAFRRLWAGQAISTFGSYFTRVAIPIYVFDTTRSYAQLGLAAFASLFGSFVFGLLMGALADRWSRRRAMVLANFASAMLLALLIGLLGAGPTVRLAGLYLISFLLAAANELFNSARLAIFPDVLDDRELLAANALDQATITFAELVSYPLVGLVLLWGGLTVAFAVDAVTYVVSAILIGAVNIPRPRSGDYSDHPPVLQAVSDGLKAVNQIPVVRRIVLLSLVVPAIISLLNTLQLPYAVDVLGSTREIGFPALEAALAVGLSLGLLLVGRWGQRQSRTALLAYGIAGLGLCFALLGALPLFILPGSPPQSHQHWSIGLLLALPLMICAGATNSLIRVGIRTSLQEQTPRQLLGRVGSIINVAASLGFGAGALLTGLAQGHVPRTLVLMGIVLFVSGLSIRGWLAQHDTAGGRAVRS